MFYFGIPQYSGICLASYLQHKEAYLTIKIMQDDAKGEAVTIPAEAFRLFVEILAQMGQGNAVQLQPIRQELHLYEAADILGVSRSYVVSLLESGEIPYWIEETVYLMRYQDVIDYKNRNDAKRMKVLDELAAEAPELKKRHKCNEVGSKINLSHLMSTWRHL